MSFSFILQTDRKKRFFKSVAYYKLIKYNICDMCPYVKHLNHVTAIGEEK